MLLSLAVSSGDTDTPATGLVAKSRYLSAEFADAERQHLWSRVWLHAAAKELVAEPGQFVALELGGTDVLVIRGKDNRVRAFHNVCLHRGRRLVDDNHGQRETLRCPLHHWHWQLNGDLGDVPGRAGFAELLDEPIKLHELACDTWAGHVFVHLGVPEQSLSDWLAPATHALERYSLADYALRDQKTYDVPCNWKALADLFNEAYHVAAVHPYLLGSVDSSSLQATLHGLHAEQVFAIGQPGTPDSDTTPTAALIELVEAAGADPAELQGDARRAPELMRRALRDRGLTSLDDEELLQGRSWFLFPSHTLNVYAHGLMLQRFRPHPSDPQRAWMDQLTYARVAADSPAEAPRVSYHVKPGGENTGQVTEDDLRQAIQVQRGMRSAGFESLRLSEHERVLLHMHRGIDRYLPGED